MYKVSTELCVFICASIGLQMTKKIKKLEKETTMYRSRWESSNKALLEMAEEVIIVLNVYIFKPISFLLCFCLIA